MPGQRPPKSQADADRRKAVAASRTAVDHSQQLMLDTDPAAKAPRRRRPITRP